MKRFEMYLKNLFQKLFSSNNIPIKVDEPTRLFNSLNKILILRQDRIGDLITSSGIIRAIKQVVPDATIDILLSIKNESAINSVIKYIDNHYTYKKNIIDIIKLVGKLRKKKYDLVIDLFDKSSLTSSSIIKLINAKYSLGIEKDNSYVYSHIVLGLNRNSIHIIDRASQILLPFGILPENVDLKPEYAFIDTTGNSVDDPSQIFISNLEKKKKHIAVVISGSDRSKFWGIENNIRLANKIYEKWNNIQIILFGTKDYSKEIYEIIERCKALAAPFVNSFDSFAKMLSRCDIIITPDTSSVHLASAFNIPAIVLYSIPDSEIAGQPWTPYKSTYKAIITDKSLRDGINPEAVILELERLMH